MFEYKMIQIPPNIEISSKDNSGNEAASYLQNIVDGNCTEGWEFYRVDSIGVSIKPGCLAGLMGRKEDSQTYYVVSFRRKKS